MKYYSTQRALATAISAVAGLFLITSPAMAAFSFLGVASGDASSNDATVWTRAADSVTPVAVSLTLQVSTDPTFATGVQALSGATVAANDYTLKLDITGLNPATVYYYRFLEPTSSTYSNVGKFKTAPNATDSYPLHFAFSGDYDGLMRPYTLGNGFTANNFDFFMNIGDTIYETASTGSSAVAATGSFGAGLPTNTTGASPSTLYTDFTRKYREQFIAINSGGQNCLQDFFAAQGNYTLLDNHELGNKQYMHGGAPAGGTVGTSSSGAGVDPAVTANDVNASGTFINKTLGFSSLVKAYSDYQPIFDRGTIHAPSDARTDGTKQLYMSQQWGKNAILINTDCRSYRDLRLRTVGNVDDNGSRADNPSRTYLGATQLAWLEQKLLDAQNADTTWKFVAVSDPIDQIGPIGGALTGSLTGVNSDGGKAWEGGYRAERNALLKFIVDHQIKNVVFLSTDDHQNRVNEIYYSPTGVTGPGSAGASSLTAAQIQALYKPVPYCFEIVDGPFGATGPETITDHSFTNIKAIADDLASRQAAAGINPIGLSASYPGLHNVVREGDANAATNPSPVDFYSPDTFNYNVLDLSADGKTLTVKSIGVNSYAQNNRVEANSGNQVGNAPRQIFSFQVDAASALNSIDHIIVVYQENWSFDGLYGSFPGANGITSASSASLAQVDRLNGNALSTELGADSFNRISQTGNTGNAPLVLTSNTNSNPGTLNNPPQPLGSPTGSSVVDTRFNTNASDPRSALSVNTLAPYLLPSAVNPTVLTGDIVHRYWHEQFQIFGAYQSGSTDAEAGNNASFITWSDNPGLVMSRFDASNLPEGLLAQQYTMCDNFYHSAFGGSFLNHQFLVSGAPPVYDNMPSSNQGNIAYVDSNGYLAMNTSGASAGKQIRDGNITPVVGDVLTGLTINGSANQSVTLNSANTEAYAGSAGTKFDKHYVVNTIRSKNLTGNGELVSAVTTLPSLNDSNPSDSTRTYTPTIGDSLSAANISWKWYSGSWNQITTYSGSNPVTTTNPSYASVNASLQMQYHHQAFAYYDNYAPFDTVNTVPTAYVGGFAGTGTSGLTAGQSGVTRAQNSAAHLQDETNFFTDVANGTLPAVCFIKPVGVNNEHPGYAALQVGQNHVAAIVQAVQANPALWAHTAIIITYDEHGGRFDHVTPPGRDIWGPGVRVPAIVISPLAKQGYVDHTSYDTSSILKTIEQRFGLPTLNSRVNSAASMAGIFTNVQITRSGYTYNRATGKYVQTLTVKNIGSVPIVGPLNVALDGLASGAQLFNKTGFTTINAPLNSPYITVSSADLAAGASISIQLQFTLSSGGITYTARSVNGTSNP